MSCEAAGDESVSAFCVPLFVWDRKKRVYNSAEVENTGDEKVKLTCVWRRAVLTGREKAEFFFPLSVIYRTFKCLAMFNADQAAGRR